MLLAARCFLPLPSATLLLPPSVPVDLHRRHGKEAQDGVTEGGREVGGRDLGDGGINGEVEVPWLWARGLVA